MEANGWSTVDGKLVYVPYADVDRIADHYGVKLTQAHRQSIHRALVTCLVCAANSLLEDDDGEADSFAEDALVALLNALGIPAATNDILYTGYTGKQGPYACWEFAF